jgi:hypothetical protein
MEPFITKTFVEPIGIQKLLKKIPDEKFLVDVNNLLADKSLSEISAGQVRDIAEKYKINNVTQRFNSKFIQILEVF